MRLLVTGAGGYLGRHVLQGLRSHGLDVVLVGRSRPAGFEDLPWIQADLLDLAGIAPMVAQARATHLLHLAWYAEYGKFWASPLNFRWVEASVRLAEAFCEQGGRHVVMAGSCAEYDWASGYLREDVTPYTPATLYGATKDATRRLVRAVCALHGAELAWGHIFFPFGPGEASRRMIPSLIRVFRGQEAPFGVNAAAFRGMLYVADAADAVVQMVLRQATGNFNICSGQPVQVAHVVRELATLCGTDPQVVLTLASARRDDPPMLVGDNTRLMSIGWRPRYTLEQGLVETVRVATSALQAF